MARWLPTNTAQRIVVGPILTGSATFPTSLTVTSVTLRAWSEDHAGGAPTLRMDSILPTASGGANDMVYLAPGWFDLEVTAAQINYLGRARFSIEQGALYLPYVEEWLVLPAHVYNGLVSSIGQLNVYASSLADPAATTLTNNVASVTAYITPSVSSIYSGMATAAALTIVDDFIDTEVSSILGYATVISNNVNSVYTGMATAAALTVVDDFVDTEVATLVAQGNSIKTETAAILAFGAPPAVSGIAAGVNSLTAYVNPSVSSIYGGMATAAALTVVDDFLDTEVSSILGYSTLISNNVNSVYTAMATAAALTVVDDFLDTEISSILGYNTAINTNVNSIWSINLNSILPLAAAAGSAGDPWSTALVPSSYGTGTAGRVMADNLNAPIGTAQASLNSLTAYVDTEVATLQVSANSITGYVLPTAIRTAVGLASANLDTQLTAIDDYLDTEIATITNNLSSLTTYVDTEVATLQVSVNSVKAETTAILADTGTDGVPLTAAAVDAILDEAVDGAVTLRQSIRLLNTASGAIVSGAGTNSMTLRDLANTKDRMTVQVDSLGNRTAFTRDLT